MARHSNRVGQLLDDSEPFLYIQSLESELKKAIAAAKRQSTQKAQGHGS